MKRLRRSRRRNSEEDAPSSDPGRPTRREFLATGAMTAVATPMLARAVPAEVPRRPAPLFPLTLTVNGQARALQVEPRVTLLDALREGLQLTGTKKGCDHGQCGACTVLVDGRRINSCLTLAVMQETKEITTIEGLAKGEELHPMQAAFIEHDGLQCGYCTPGQILSAVALLTEPGGVADADVREGMSGNLCRCGAYSNIVSAIQDVRRKG